MTRQAELLQRIPIRNAWLLLLYAHDLAKYGGAFRARVEQAPDLRALMGAVLVESVRPLVRQHLGTTFQRQDRTLTGVRGRIRVGPSLPHLARRDGKTRCQVPVRTPDTLIGRILRATLRSLATSDPGLGGALPTELLQEVRGLLHALIGVSEVPLTSALFSQLRLGRSDARWAFPMSVCRMLYRQQLLTESAGEHASTSLLHSEITHHQLFERFVRSFYQVHHPEWRQPPRSLRWWESTTADGRATESPFLPGMVTDIILERPPGERIVIDTKFYTRTLAEGWGGTKRFHSDNLYQLYAYLRTQEHRGARYRSARGVLLYPTVDWELDESFEVQGHEFRVATVDLAGTWSSIATRLEELLITRART